MRSAWIVLLVLLPFGLHAEQRADRLMLEAGIVGGNSGACPGHYVGINGRVAGPLSVYGMVENYRCAEFAGSANRAGVSLLLGRYDWLIRPALRLGIEYDGGETSETAGASLTFGRRHGARFILHFGELSDGSTLVLLQMGGYVTF